MVSIAPPCVVVIFGARGDLTKRLLMPAFYNLVLAKQLDTDFRILGVDHGDITKDAWTKSLTEMMQSFTKDASAEFHPDTIDHASWDWITQRCDYVRGDFEDDATYHDLVKKLETTFTADVPKNVMFYIATAPKFFAAIVEGLGKAGLLKESEHAFRRVVIEKPFGHDEPSAAALNACILQQGDESQFYRIDHFMGKEAVRGIYNWRFANRLFETIWNRNYIDHVQITAAETIDIEERGAFYETTGALRDMVPSHLFSLMAMVAMEPPVSESAEDVRNAHAQLLQAIQPVTPEHVIRGQYRAGEVHGEHVTAYRESQNVASDSRTETYAALHLTVETPRWNGVPFYIRTGKALAGHTTHVAVFLKPGSSFTLPDDVPNQNIVHFQISGSASINIHMLAKKPGPKDHVAPVVMEFSYQEAFAPRSTVGYETLLFDCMCGDQTLFLRDDAIEAGWRAVQPVLEAWANAGEPQMYTAGSPGPTDADALLAASGRAWLPLRE